MNTSGEIVLEAGYQDLKEANNGIYIAKQNDKYGIIDNVGNIQIPLSIK